MPFSDSSPQASHPEDAQQGEKNPCRKTGRDKSFIPHFVSQEPLAGRCTCDEYRDGYHECRYYLPDHTWPFILAKLAIDLAAGLFMTALGTIIVRFHSRIDNKTPLIVEKSVAFKLFLAVQTVVCDKSGLQFCRRAAANKGAVDNLTGVKPMACKRMQKSLYQRFF
jgi:hypothetical protein